MKYFSTILFLLFIGISTTQAQRLEKFSDNSGGYMKELNELMTASKRDVMKDIFERFEKLYKAGYFNAEEMEAIIKVGNGMLNQRMTASPYFSEYLEGLMTVKNTEFGEQRFREWHSILEQISAVETF
jgi:hypothetical protein